MNPERKQGPRTAQQALIAELLDEVGLVHDAVKALPDAMRVSLKPTIDVINDSIVEARALTEELREARSELGKARNWTLVLCVTVVLVNVVLWRF